MDKTYKTELFYCPPADGEKDECRVAFWYMQPSDPWPAKNGIYDVYRAEALLDNEETRRDITPPSTHTKLAERLDAQAALALLQAQEKAAEPHRIETAHDWIFGVHHTVIWAFGQCLRRVVRVDPYFLARPLTEHPQYAAAPAGQAETPAAKPPAGLQTTARRMGDALKLKPVKKGPTP
jgi:hypothetical protein